MIEIRWTISLNCKGGKFIVPEGMPDTEIRKIVAEHVNGSVSANWSPYIFAGKEDLRQSSREVG